MYQRFAVAFGERPVVSFVTRVLTSVGRTRARVQPAGCSLRACPYLSAPDAPLLQRLHSINSHPESGALLFTPGAFVWNVYTPKRSILCALCPDGAACLARVYHAGPLRIVHNRPVRDVLRAVQVWLSKVAAWQHDAQPHWFRRIKVS